MHCLEEKKQELKDPKEPVENITKPFVKLKNFRSR